MAAFVEGGHHQQPPPPNRVRWGELEEDDGEDLDFLLPPRMVIGPDENGVKKVIEYKFNEEGNKIKITTTSRARKLAQARLTKRALERRSWAKFGDASHQDANSRFTVPSTEEILLERPRPPGYIYSSPYLFVVLFLLVLFSMMSVFLSWFYWICSFGNDEGTKHFNHLPQNLIDFHNPRHLGCG